MRTSGLSGYFGHTFVTDEHGHKRIQYQFRVVRRLPPNRWVVQFFSFWDGTPNKLGVYTEDFLLSDDVALYQTEEIWRVEYEKSERRYSRLADQRGS
jgi:hypothetical protein